MQSMIQTLQDWIVVLLSETLGDHGYAAMVTNLVLTLFTILIYWLIYILVFRGFRALSRRVLKEDSDIQPLRIQKQEILSAGEMAKIISRTLLYHHWLFKLRVRLV